MSSIKGQVSSVTACSDCQSYSINRNFAYRGQFGLGSGLNCHLEFGEDCVVNLLYPPRYLESEIRFSASLREEKCSRGKTKYFCGQNRMQDISF